MSRSKQYSCMLLAFAAVVLMSPGSLFAQEEMVPENAKQLSDEPVLSATVEPTSMQDGWEEKFMQQLEVDDEQEAERVDKIKRRIMDLKAILRKERAAAEANRRLTKQASTDNNLPEHPVDPPPVELSAPETTPKQVPIVTVPENNNPVQPELSESDVDPSMSAESLDNGIQVIANPVNSFELANSLFATGSYDQALKSYEALLQKEVSDYDRDWLLCLSASCYRLNGDISKAESLYREVMASKDKSHANDYSQWFLDHLTKKKQLQEELRLLTAELASASPGGSQ